MTHSRIFLIVLLITCSGSTLLANKIDTIFFQKGDKITGEVKSLTNNKLKLSTDDVGTIYVEWDKIDSVKILNTMRIEMEEGRILFGVLLTAGIKGSCYIWSRTEDPLLTELVKIVSLSPIEDRFVDRLNGSLGSSFSYVKASDVLQLSMNATIKYLAEKNYMEIFYNGILSSESDTSFHSHNAGGSFRRTLPNNWFLGSQLSAESNSELQLDLRTSILFGGGKALIRTNHSNLFLAAGFMVNRENSADVQQYNLEGAITFDYSIFIYDNPKVSFDLKANLYPSLNDLGRIRSYIGSDLNWEIFSDFYLKWSFYFNSDNRPLSGTTAKTDWAVSLFGAEYKF